MKTLSFLLLACTAFVLIGTTGCEQVAVLPTESTLVDRFPVLYPDYTSVTIPPNIAPMNFRIDELADEYVTSLSGKNGTPILVAGKSIQFELEKWKTLLAANVGEELRIDVYAKSNGQWSHFRTVVNTVSKDPIDSWLAYRLIEPGYEFFNHLTLNQRNLETFEERPFAYNMLVSGKMCINCHSFQNRGTERFLFHTRNQYPGTVFVENGKAKKVGLKPEEFFSHCAYPAWHPTENKVAFSINKTFQIFHSQDANRIEVIDELSDLVLYDGDKNEITPILRTPDDLETFPSWSQDGKYLYYCNAHIVLPPPDAKEEEVDIQRTEIAITPRRKELRARVRDLKYNLMRVARNPETGLFGKPEMVVDAAAKGKSILHPRVTPDNKYVLFTMADFGTFPIWHPESDLYLVEVATGKVRPVEEVNSNNTESYHTWDSSGRWFVFSSRRDDGSFTRLYFSHFDENGRAAKPFLLPQLDPDRNKTLMYSFNVPELIREPIKESILQLMKNASINEPPTAKYKSER